MTHRHLGFAMVCALVAGACSSSSAGVGSIDPYYDDPPIGADVPPNVNAFAPFQTPLPPKGPPPNFGATVTQKDAPPPISGGTLIVTKDGKLAVAADPDRDQVYVVSLADQTVVTIALQPHDEPGRVALDADGRAHVVLRRGGSIATIDLATGTLLSRRAVCAAPRGIAFDASSLAGADPRLLVVCEGGDVIALPPVPNGTPSTLTRLDRDLRDVVVSGTRIFVSHFRHAQRVELDGTGAVVSRLSLPGTGTGATTVAGSAALAWRMIPSGPADSEPIIVHQLARVTPVVPAPGGYGDGDPGGDGCSGGAIVSSALSVGGGNVIPLPGQTVLPVDLVASETSFLIVAAGNGHTKDLDQIIVVPRSSNACSPTNALLEPQGVRGQVTAIALLGDAVRNGYVVQSREPAQLQLFPSGQIIPLSSTSREDTGHAIFHSNSGSNLACASCHGEGGDDGHVWTFVGEGARRTPSLRGTLKGTAPYHWGGDMADISTLADNVMTGRMNGPNLAAPQKDALEAWLFALPAPTAPAPTDASAVARGRTLFESAAVGCSGCHAGSQFTSKGTIWVGTGGAFQIPSLLGVGARAPYLHDGCAATLKDRFGACGGSNHGKTEQLSPANVDDLVSYLNTL